MAGVVLGTALAWLTGYPILRIHLLLFVAAIVGVWFLFGDWMREGRCRGDCRLVAAIALLVNLLAAGGIGFPGVADSLWLLLAISLNVCGAMAQTRARACHQERPLASGLAFAALLVTAIWLEYSRS